jgi:hypothetical protein
MVKATIAGKMLESPPRNYEVEALCSCKFNMAYCRVIQSEFYQHHKDIQEDNAKKYQTP